MCGAYAVLIASAHRQTGFGILLARLIRAQQERRLIASALARLTPRLTRSVQRPPMTEMLERSRELTSLLDEICPGWEHYRAEIREVQVELERRYQAQAVAFPREYSIETAAETLLYVLVRSRRPRIVLETGVANGHCTVVLLAGLRRNGQGQLHSTDVLSNVGSLLTPGEREEWRFHRLPDNGLRRTFAGLLSELGSVDLYFHDSEHSYGWQSFEYEMVLARLAKNGAIISDDVDASYAFLDFCSRHRVAPVTVLDHHKFIGFVQRN